MTPHDPFLLFPSDGPPAQAHSPTSVAAADSVRERGPVLRARVLEFVKARKGKGATDEEMQAGLGMNPSTQRPRRVELVGLGLVVDSGKTRKTKSGRSAVVWVAAGWAPGAAS